MTKVFDGITVLTFDEWKRKPEVIEAYAEVEECAMCHGTGSHDCDCGDTHTCGECDGVGKERSQREIYERALRDEIKRLRSWQAGEAIHVPGPGPTLRAPDAATLSLAGDLPASN
jgi:hypothetical protein